MVASRLPVMVCVLLMALSVSPSAWADDAAKRGPRVLDRASAAALGVGRLVPDVTFNDLSGKAHRLSEVKGANATVIALTNTSCPLSMKYAPALARFEKQWSSRGVSFVFLNLDTAAPVTELREAVKTIGFRGPYVHDKTEAFGKALQAKTTTEVFVLDAARTLVYRGAVDDRYGLGYALDAPRVTYLNDALEALQRGESPNVVATDAPGCVLGLEPAKQAATKITYHNRISRIMQNNCVECHHTGGIAPFALQTYKQVRSKKGMIDYVVEHGIMPPWFASKESGPFRNDRSLSADDKRDLIAWVEGGCVEGDQADAPLPRVFKSEWAIGEPDLIVELPRTVDVKAEGVMPYVNLTAGTGVGEERWVQAVEIKPTSPGVVHHVLVHVKGDWGKGFLAAYVPGNSHVIYPQGLAKRLPADATLHFQLHYTPNGKATTDRTRIGIKFAKGLPKHEVVTHGVSNRRIRIPAGASNHKEVARRPIPADLTVLGFMPHMHTRGKAFKYVATLPSGRQETLLDVPRYDFNWQLRYDLAEPFVLPRGSRIEAIGWFDNSKENPANPDPTKEVRWGDQTTDEMLIGYVEFYVNNKPVEAAKDKPKTLLQRLRDRRRSR